MVNPIKPNIPNNNGITSYTRINSSPSNFSELPRDILFLISRYTTSNDQNAMASSCQKLRDLITTARDRAWEFAEMLLKENWLVSSYISKLGLDSESVHGHEKFKRLYEAMVHDLGLGNAPEVTRGISKFSADYYLALADEFQTQSLRKCWPEIHSRLAATGAPNLPPMESSAKDIRGWLKSNENSQFLNQITTLHFNLLDLKIIPDEINLFTNLEVFSIFDSQIEMLNPNQFHGLTNLKDLRIMRNQLAALSPNQFEGLVNLGFLYLRENKLVELHPNQFHGLRNLNFLDLAVNKLQRLKSDQFHGLTSLIYLNLASNSIGELEQNAFEGLANLNWLKLENNAIEELASNQFNGLEKLELLDLQYNRLQAWDSSLCQGLKKLKTLNLDNNPCSKNQDGVQAFQPASSEGNRHP